MGDRSGPARRGTGLSGRATDPASRGTDPARRGTDPPGRATGLPGSVADALALPEPTRIDLDVPVATWTLGPDRPGEGSAATGGRRPRDVVLCHGTPWSARVWAPVARELARDRRVHLWDMPGYGESVPLVGEGSDVDLVAQRRRLAALTEHLGLDRPHLVGHDIGGAVVLGAHLFEGLEAASVHLLDVVTLDPWGSPFFRLVAEHEDVFGALPPDLHAALVREYVAGAGGHGLDPGLPALLAAPWTTTAGRPAFYRQIASLTPEDTRPIVARLGDVRVPTRIAWGEDDPWIPAAQAHELAGLLPGTPAVTLLPGIGHLAPLEAAHAVTSELRDWFAAVEG
ncbi:MAG: alpha/beta fold hydrolase [Actinomycetaceae bacterium]